MAQVKISDLPNMTATIAGNDVIVLNDTSANVTNKCSLTNLYEAFIVNATFPDGITATLNGAPVTTVPIYYTVLLGRIVGVKLAGGYTGNYSLTNNTNARMAAQLNLNIDTHVHQTPSIGSALWVLDTTRMWFGGDNFGAVYIEPNSTITAQLDSLGWTGVADSWITNPNP